MGIRALYNFNHETEFLPAAALVVGTSFPTGPAAAGLGVRLRGILTKYIGRAEFNLNAEFTKVGFRTAEDRLVR